MAAKEKAKDKAKEELKVDEEPKKGGSKLIIIIAAALLGVGIGALAVYFLVGGSEPEQVAEEAVEQRVQSLYYKLEKPFVVNLISSGRPRHMQVDVAIKGKDKAAMEALEKHEPVIKNDLNQLFGSQQMEVLQTQEGLMKMNEDATKIVQAFMEKEIGAPGIDQVLFTNFVMQ